MRSHGLDTVAFARLIEEAAMRKEAEAQGLVPSPSEVEEAVERQRALLAEVRQGPPAGTVQLDSGALARLDAAIEAMGEDFYWSTYAPAEQFQGMMKERLIARVTSGLSSLDERQAAMRQYAHSLVLDAQVEVVDDTHVVAGLSTDAATAYMEAYAELQ